MRDHERDVGEAALQRRQVDRHLPAGEPCDPFFQLRHVFPCRPFLPRHTGEGREGEPRRDVDRFHAAASRRATFAPYRGEEETDARRARLEHHHRPRRLSSRAERRRRHQDVRQSRHDRAADHACALLGARDGLCAGPAGSRRHLHGRRLRPRLGQAGVVQRPCRARPRQRHRLDLHLADVGHADDRHGRPAGAGPRPHRAPALCAAGADRPARREVGDRGQSHRGPAAHPAARRQDRDHGADRPGVHLAARRHLEQRGGHRHGSPNARRHGGAPERRRAGTARQAPARREEAGDPGRPRDRHLRCLRRGDGARRDAGRAGAAADRGVGRAFPVGASGLSRRAQPRPEERAPDPQRLRPDVLRRRRRPEDVGVERDRAAARDHGGGDGRPARLGDGQELPGRDCAARRREGDAEGAGAAPEEAGRRRPGRQGQGVAGRDRDAQLERPARRAQGQAHRRPPARSRCTPNGR